MPSVIEIPTDIALFQLPDGLQSRLQFLLDRQDAGVVLKEAERKEAVYVLLKLRTTKC
ncbi:MAG: hypothetical protein ACRCYY_15875 [Trueperaceae bacterium]